MEIDGSRRRGRAAGRVAVVLLAVAGLAACSPDRPPVDAAAVATPEGAPPAQTPAVDATPDVPATSDPAPTPDRGATFGGDGSEIVLDALTAGDVAAAALPGELACSFATAAGASILHASGDAGSAEPAQGVVKVAGYVEPVRAPGGFDGILGDATFTGQGKTLRLALTGAAIGGGESPPRPATLTYQRADGASRVFEGRWQCGP
ncbi:hypothetical protein [Pseudoxanthomonas sp. 10H]|uniref:hypothetical protein n=1 Tax=Pseudoxanthomonas sp. 10H TaxID=3242729 RepID=UPI0035564B9D